MTVQEFSLTDDAAEAEVAGLDHAIEAARGRLFSIQHEDGHWCGELEGDTILESEYLLLLYYLGRANESRFHKGAEYLRRQQLSDGGWSIYAGGPTDLLSIFGQHDWAKCPAVPPELILLPDWFVFNIYKMSYWSRAIIVPLSIIWAFKPNCVVPDEWSIRELYAPEGAKGPHVKRSRRERFWRGFFNVCDSVLNTIENLRLKPLRRRALRKATRWIVEHLDKSGGLGAIFPPIINTIFAFRGLGHSADHPVIQSQLRALESLEIEEADTLRLQPCFSAVWDTALAVHTLRESGTPADDPALLNGVRWLLEKEVRTVGDWKRNNPAGEGSGWFFQYENEFYPDTDDTSEVLLALAGARFPDPREEKARQDAVDRAIRWQLTMQNTDGGWGAFDKGCDNEIFTFIPFADHNAMIDPSCDDITGRTLEALVALRFDTGHPAIRRRYRRIARWLTERQNPDGGWGELQHSYDDPKLKGVGPSTPSQTAWALLSLLATGNEMSEAAERGVEYLLDRQHDDGSWRDDYWTATGFPKVFYLRYHLYATYFPLWALAEYRRARVGVDGDNVTRRTEIR